MGEQGKIVTFATAVCLACSLILSGVYSSLKPRQDENAELDLRAKVLQAFGVAVKDEKGKKIMTNEEISALFDSAIEGHVIDSEGNFVDDRNVAELTPEDINDRDSVTKLKQFYPYFTFTDPDSGKKRYAIHVSGMGLWSVVKGYLALEEDLGTIAGLAVYAHAETPGLGGDVDKQWFVEQFIGKKMISNGEVQRFRVLKPSEVEDDSSVHGPSGATMTCNGMTYFINADFDVYNKHFASLKGS